MVNDSPRLQGHGAIGMGGDLGSLKGTAQSEGPAFQALDNVSHADMGAQSCYTFPCFKRRWKSGILCEISQVFNVGSPFIEMVGGLHHSMSTGCQFETSNLEKANSIPACLAGSHGD